MKKEIRDKIEDIFKDYPDIRVNEFKFLIDDLEELFKTENHQYRQEILDRLPKEKKIKILKRNPKPLKCLVEGRKEGYNQALRQIKTKEEEWEKRVRVLAKVDIDLLVGFVRALVKFHKGKTIEGLIEWVEEKKIETHNLPSDNGGKCELVLDHTPVWDGNYYTCSKCGKEFVPADWINQTLKATLSYLQSIKEKV